MPRVLPRSWSEGERYFSQGIKEQFLREMRNYVQGQVTLLSSPGVSLRCMADKTYRDGYMYHY